MAQRRRRVGVQGRAVASRPVAGAFRLGIRASFGIDMCAVAGNRPGESIVMVVPKRWRAAAWQLENSPIGTAALLHDWSSLLRVNALMSPFDEIWTVRRAWPDSAHQFISPRRDSKTALRALEAHAWYWRRGPIRPFLTLVPMTLAEFRAHARGEYWCRSTSCPAVPALGELAVQM